MVKRTIDSRIMESLKKYIEKISQYYKIEAIILFGSYAKGTATKYSDLDFIIYGQVDMEKLREQIDEIMTLKKIDLFEYDLCRNQYLKEDMDRYARKIY